VRNLLDFAKKRELRPVPTDLREAADLALEFLDGELVRGGVAASVEGPRPLLALADPDLLHQVLVNLVLNAIHAMEATERPARLTIRLVPTGSGMAAIEVEDTGPGLSPELLDSIFQPFFTTKPGGTGLGLVVARRIAEEHGGRLEAEQTPTGARFRVVLPAVEAAPAGVTHG